MCESIVTYIVWNLTYAAGTCFGILLITWFCFTKAVKMFYFRCGPGMGGVPVDWWDYPFIPVFGYFIMTLFAAFATVYITQDCVENILETLRNATLINF